jgi:hypothetical protein
MPLGTGSTIRREKEIVSREPPGVGGAKVVAVLVQIDVHT